MLHALITGHSRGLGAAVALQLKLRGARVLGVSRGEGPAGVESVALDLADPVAVRRWLDSDTLQSWLRPATSVVLVNNAGTVQPVAPAGRLDPAALSAALALNVMAPLMLTDAVIAALPANLPCRVVHVSSGAARKPYAGWSAYCSSKAALDMHARVLALEARPGLRVESLAPGVLDTEMQAELRGSPPDTFPDRARFVELHREGALVPAADAGRRLVDHLLSPAFGQTVCTDLRLIAP